MGLLSKSTALALVLLCTSANTFALELHELLGTWRGSYNINIGGDRQVVLVLSESADGIAGHFEDPSNGVFGIAVETISIEDDEIQFAIPRIDGNYYGTVHTDRAADGQPVRIDGDWSQLGEFMRITLYRDIAP